MVVTKNCFLGNVFTGFTLVEKFSPKNVVVVVVLPLPNKRTNGVEPLIQEERENFFESYLAGERDPLFGRTRNL